MMWWRHLTILAMTITACYLMTVGAFEIHHGAGVFFVGVLISIVAKVLVDITE